MVFFNHATRQMTAKIVYYGPGLCGKTTNLNIIYGQTSQKARGEMVSLNTETDRTLFFDLLPMDVGVVGGFKTKLQLYTVPGQVFYNSTRKLVLKGVDGIVFVADSQVPTLEANKESLQNLEANLKELGINIQEIPLVFQWNKRDLKNIVPLEELERVMNPNRHLSFESSAQQGIGVFETLRGITKLALTHIKAHHLGETAPPLREERSPKSLVLELPADLALDLPSDLPPDLHSDLPPISAPTPVKPLSFADLPSASDVLGDIAPTVPVAKKTTPSPLRPLAPFAMPSPRPIAALPPSSLGRMNPAPRPSISPMTMPVSSSATPKAKSPAPKTMLNAILGDFTNVGSLGNPSVIKVELPPYLDGGSEIEVLVQIRQGEQTVAQGQLKRTAPNAGITSKLTLELKRS